MSINDFSNKIKSKLGIDNITILYFLIIIGVGIASFGLGQLSTTYSSDSTDNSISQNEEQDTLNVSSNNIKIINTDTNISTDNKEEKMFVASKNGKLYYSISCSGAKRIKEENKIWFATISDAEKSGYSLASSCK